jgi:hypothetical protein
MHPRLASPRGWWLATAGVAVALAGAAAPAGAASPKPPPPDAPDRGSARPGQFSGPGDAAKRKAKGDPVRTQRPSAQPRCDLPPDADRPEHDEWLSCISVGASLDHVPEVGEEATLRIDLRADRSLDADVAVTLPPNLEWVEAPAGLTAGDARSRRPETRGAVDIARGERTLAADGTVRITGRVRAVAEGATQIDVRATSPRRNGVEAGADSVFLAVPDKQPAAERRPPRGAGDVVRVEPGPAVRSTDAPPQSVGTEGLRQPERAGAPCDTRVAGNWGYNDQNGAWHNAMNFQVQVWNRNTLGDSLLATGITDGGGNYNLCFDSAAEPWPESGTVDPYVRFISENAIWRVQRGGAPMTFQTGVTSNISPGTTLNLGSLTAGDGTLHRGLHAFDEANDAWLWIPKPNNSCFDQKDASCRQLRINWAPDSTDGTYYSLAGNDVHLAANDPNAPMTVVHEIGHAIMDDVYNDAYPSAPNCSPHSVPGSSSAGCAWTEGWAEWFPATVYNDPFFRWPSGASLNLETPTWDTAGWANGDTVEGRVAGALIDVTDAANETPWDRHGEGRNPIWQTFTGNVSNTLAQFWTQRAANGFAAGDIQLGVLFQNTIDYGFRDPLGSYAELTRPTPGVPHNYGFSTTSPYWSVTAIRPPAGSDYDLDVYDDRAQTAYLGASVFGGSTVDFVAVDTNRRPTGDYYPRVRRYSGSGGAYQIENARGSDILGYGTSPIAMGASDVVAVRDVWLTAGVQETFKVAAANAGQDAELFVLRSDAAASTWVRSRATAAAAAAGNGPGAIEQVGYTAPTSGWYGIVLVNKSGSGTYSVTRTQGAAAPSTPTAQ